MFAANGSRSNLSLRHALAGLQAGVLGSLVMLGYLMIGSLWDGRSIWSVPNLFATTFFGSGSYRNELFRHTWTGIALLVAIYGLLGAIWGCLWRERRTLGLTFYGAIAGLAVYYFFFSFVWKHANPLLALYAPTRQLEVAHVLWGVVLGWSPQLSRRIAQRLKATPTADAGPEVPVQTGEVMQ